MASDMQQRVAPPRLEANSTGQPQTVYTACSSLTSWAAVNGSAARKYATVYVAQPLPVVRPHYLFMSVI